MRKDSPCLAIHLELHCPSVCRLVTKFAASHKSGCTRMCPTLICDSNLFNRSDFTFSHFGIRFITLSRLGTFYFKTDNILPSKTSNQSQHWCFQNWLSLDENGGTLTTKTKMSFIPTNHKVKLWALSYVWLHTLLGPKDGTRVLTNNLVSGCGDQESHQLTTLHV